MSISGTKNESDHQPRLNSSLCLRSTIRWKSNADLQPAGLHHANPFLTCPKEHGHSRTADLSTGDENDNPPSLLLARGLQVKIGARDGVGSQVTSAKRKFSHSPTGPSISQILRGGVSLSY